MSTQHTTHVNGHQTSEWKESANEALDDAKERLSDLDTQVRSFVRERPLVAVGAAIAAGFLVGRLFK